MAALPRDFLKSLPAALPKGEPYYFLSDKQRKICERHKELAPYAPHLPGWVPHRRVADALGHPHSGIEAALRRLEGRPYVWATEFENVHTFWNYSEPGFTVEGRKYQGSEDFFHKQKPLPFNKAVWDGDGRGLGHRDQVMRMAVQKKFADPELQELLLASNPHPLLSIKGDEYWGVRPTGQGHNMLAELLMELRQELMAGSIISRSVSAPEVCVSDAAAAHASGTPCGPCQYPQAAHPAAEGAPDLPPTPSAIQQNPVKSTAEQA